ncbi:MAG: peptide deformylase [Pirellulales bacterium]|nr:peptide deformylase [Pirellulales bacterium]
MRVYPTDRRPGAMRIIHYPHPTLRHRSKPLKRVDAELQHMVRQMFDLMYEAKGIGLAANQVDLPYRLFILNLESDPEKPELEQVFINPVISGRKGTATAEEGCLSLPGLYADVTRPERVTINAYNLRGEEIDQEIEGLFARAVQHEVDHLDGVLFIDRLNETSQIEVRDVLGEFETNFESRRRSGEIGDDTQIAARIAELERLRT